MSLLESVGVIRVEPYATQMLEVKKTPIHTLAKQMGISVGIIEKHYSHLVVMNAKDQLRGESIVNLR